MQTALARHGRPAFLATRNLYRRRAAGGELGVVDRPRTIRIPATLRAIGTDLTPLPAVAILDAGSFPLVAVVVGRAIRVAVFRCYPLLPAAQARSV